MTFEEQLQRSFGTLSDHLRDETARALIATGAEVAARANEARDAAVREAADAAREEAEATARVEIARLERQVQDMTADSESREQWRAADVAACERLVASVRAIDRAQSLSDILDMLVDCASREATRVGLLVVRNGELRGWRFAGFGDAADPAGSIVVRAEEGGIVGEAVRTGVAVWSAATGVLAAPAFAEGPGYHETLAVPLVVSGDVAAVLYADQATSDKEHPRSAALKWPDTLELFACHAARCLEAATAIKAVRVLTDPPEISESASSKAGADGPTASTNADLRSADAREPELRASN
jgi:hypothetical protein